MTEITTRRTAGDRDAVREAARAAAARVAHSDVVAPRDRRRDVARPPGPGGADLVQRLVTRRQVLGFFADMEHRYPTIAHLRLLGEHVYVVSDPALIVDVFVNHGRQTMKGRSLQGAKAILGNGLLTSEGETHLRQRRLVQPAFHRDRIAAYSLDMVRLAMEHQDSWVDGARVDMARDMSALTLAIVGRTLFGSDLTGEAAEVGAALDEVLNGTGARLMLGPRLLSVPTPSRHRALRSAARLESVVQGMIDVHRAAGDTGDMMSMLIAAQEDGVGMDDAQVRDEAMTLVLAGHETTAMTLSWTWLLLSRHPEIAEWMHEEHASVLGGRPPTMDDLPRLARTRAVVAESIRRYPPAWAQGRRLLADAEVGGWTVPAGAMVIASPFALHRSPRWWPSARAFLPERWLTVGGSFSEEAPGQPRGAWFPFGWGNRRCIGESFAWTEAVLVLATLAPRWRPVLEPGHEVTPRAAITLRPAGGLPMRLSRRY